MKQFYLLAAALFASCTLSAQIIYVDADATGAGDGSTWADAFTNVTDAVNAAANGESIWIAEGIYNEGASVFINKALAIEGGFVGTETMADQANPFVNITTITGDVNGDDMEGEYEMNRSDNVRIFEVDSLIAPAFGPISVAFRGLNLDNGQAASYTDTLTGDPGAFSDPIDPAAGGAIRSYSPIAVQFCDFEDNDGDYSGAVALFPGADNSFIQVNSFSNNRSIFGGIVYGRIVVGPFVTGCTFTENIPGRGCVEAIGALGTVVDGCSFVENVAISDNERGCGVGVLFSEQVTISRSTFTNNRAVFGGAVYLLGDGTEDELAAENVLIDSCDFTGNVGIVGGGILSIDGGFTMRRSVANQNAVEDTGEGGFLFQLGRDIKMEFDSCSFDNNVGRLGGAIFASDSASVVTIRNSEFANHTGSAAGAAICLLGENTPADLTELNAGSPDLNVDNSLFFNNDSGRGGAIYLQGNESTTTGVYTNSQFLNNSSPTGGAISHFFASDLTITDCLFNSNTSTNLGGAVDVRTFYLGDPRATIEQDRRESVVNIQSSKFQLNGADAQGGAIYSAGASMDITNSEFYLNLVTGNNADNIGIGGAIGFNGDSAKVLPLNLVNNTFVNNSAVTEGDQVAIFQDPLDPLATTETTLNLTNNAFVGFDNPEAGFVVIEEDSEGEIITNGGNFFNVAVDDFTLDGTDIFDDGLIESDLFVNAEAVTADQINLSPLRGSDLVDAGVATASVPVDDINDTPRDATPDIGAVEIRGTVVDIAINSGIHNTLVQVLTDAGLVPTLQGDGPFTVFAPTDDAFAAIPDSVLMPIVANVNECLIPTLSYHVIVNATDDGVVYSREIIDGDVEMGTTFQGEALEFDADNDDNVSVTHPAGVADVIAADLVAKNGVVHVINQVMLPQAVLDNPICLGISNVNNLADSGLELNIFPNPVVEKLEINALDARISDFEMSLIDNMGRFVTTYKLGNGSHELDMTNLATGNYTLLFIVEGEMYSTQIIKQ